MAFNEQAFRRDAARQGFSQQEINSYVQKRNAQERTGLSKWLFGDRTSALGKGLSAVGNVLSLPSYAIGGMLDEVQKQGLGAFNPMKNAFGLSGAASGVKNKEALMQELPETFGVDPNSGAGMALGFAGELLTPGLPLGKVAQAGGRALGVGQDVVSLGSSLSGITDDAARTFLEKSYKLSASDIDKIADAIGVIDEAEKSRAVIDYLQGLGMRGSTRGSLNTLGGIIDPIQKQYSGMTRAGGSIPRSQYAQSLLDQAIEVERFGTPQARRQAQQLLDEASLQERIGGFITDKDLTDIKTRAFNEATESKIGNPYQSSLSELIGRSGIESLEKYAPGSKEVGQNLRKLRTTQDVIGKKARTGLGTQLLNAFKPSALGAGIGAGYGAASGQDPLKSAVVGAGLLTGVNSPQALNFAGRALSGKSNLVNRGVRAAGRTIGTGVVVGARTANQNNETGSQLRTQRPVQPQATQQTNRKKPPKSPSFSFRSNSTTPMNKKRNLDVYFGY